MVGLVALVLSVGTFASCNGSDSTSPAKSIEQETWAPILNVDLSKYTKLSTGVYIQDVVVGTGTEATASSSVSVNYEGRLTNGSLFDAGTLTFYPLSGLIKGWQYGIPGMKIGGTRRLLVPASLGYGNQTTGTIPANSNLYFSVTLTNLK